MTGSSEEQKLRTRKHLRGTLIVAFFVGLAEYAGGRAWDLVASLDLEAIASHLQPQWQNEAGRRQLLASLIVVGNLLVSAWVGYRSRGLAALQAWSASSVVYCITHLVAIAVHGTVFVSGPALAALDVTYAVMSMFLLVHLHKQGDLGKLALDLSALAALLLSMLSLYASQSDLQPQISQYVSVFGMLSAAMFWWHARHGLSKWQALLLLGYPVALSARVVATECSGIAFGFWSAYQLFCYAKIAIASLEKKATAAPAKACSPEDDRAEA